MIRLARSERLAACVQDRRWLAGLAARFVGGPDVASALETARALRADGITTSLFFLGEYVRDPAVVAVTVQRLREMVTQLRVADLDAHISVDPTQIGLMADEETCEANLRDLARTVGAGRVGHDTVMVDMEDAGTTEVTLRMHDRLRADGMPIGVTVQAYLHRTAADIHRLASAGAWVRLVKGAFAEPAALAARRRADIDQRYRQSVATLLAAPARQAGCYPSFATHDERLINEIIASAQRLGWAKDEFEFEMLYGVRPELQRQLAGQGYRVRVYLPFGVDWFPYAIRRVGESPRNLRFAVRAVVRG